MEKHVIHTTLLAVGETFYMETIVFIIPTNLVTILTLVLCFLLIQTKNNQIKPI